MHYVDSGQSRGLLLVVPSVDEIGHDVGYCATAPPCRIGACCAVLVEPWICLRTGKWVIPGCAGGARSPASRSDCHSCAPLALAALRLEADPVTRREASRRRRPATLRA